MQVLIRLIVYQQVAEKLMNCDDSTRVHERQLPTELYEPYALVFFSTHAFHNAFARFMAEFGLRRWDAAGDCRPEATAQLGMPDYNT